MSIDDEIKKAQIKDHIKVMSEEVQMLIESFGVIARATKAYYDSLVKAGFSEQQALEFTMKRETEFWRAKRD